MLVGVVCVELATLVLLSIWYRLFLYNIECDRGACLILGRGEDEIKPERQTSEIQSLHVGKPTDRVRLPGSVRSVLFFSASSDWIVIYVYTTRITWMRRKQEQPGEGWRKKYIVRYKQSTLKMGRGRGVSWFVGYLTFDHTPFKPSMTPTESSLGLWSHCTLWQSDKNAIL